MAAPLHTRLQQTYSAYPSQFWLMFSGLLVSRIGTSMIWPFLLIFASERLQLPMAAVASLLTINAVSGITASFLAGPLVDRLGRKWMMVGSLALLGVVYLSLSRAVTLPHFAGLMVFFGALNPLYAVAADAMLADLVPAEKRTDAYALMRLSANAGIAIGPAVGGVLVMASYNLAFFLAAVGLILFSLLLLFFARETLPVRDSAGPVEQSGRQASMREAFGGHLQILGDRGYTRFLLWVTLGTLPGMLMWTLMPIYAKQNYGVEENLYGLIPTTNALMVVLFQLPVTKATKPYPDGRIMALGSLFYSLGAGIVGLARGFGGFWLSMVVMTFGEMALVPTSTSHAANLAPTDKRGRYMSLYNLTWSVAMAVGPLFGGALNDRVGPWAIWAGGLLVGLISVAGFLRMERRNAVRF
jgi:MFS family permease